MNKGFWVIICFLLLGLGFTIGTLSTKSSFASKAIEYNLVDYNVLSPKSQKTESAFKQLGSEGWEFIGVTGNYFIFKR